MLKRLVLGKVEGWVVGLILLAGLLMLIAFGALVRGAVLGNGGRFGALSAIALSAAEFPANAARVIQVLISGEKLDLQVAAGRFEGKAGLMAGPQGFPADDGYLLLSRFDGERGRSVVELVDLAEGQTVHTWAPDFAAINARSRLESKITDLLVDNGPSRARMMHPLVEPDGALLYNNMSPLVKIDACGQPVWTLDRLAHHSIERHPDGGYWISLHVEPQTTKGVSKTFVEDSIAHVSADGEILFEKSLPELLIENGLQRLIFGLDFYSDDPLHLNDIQPALADGPYWQRGDVFLSLRNVSAIILYRPSENRVLWLKQEPWVNQHDVDILDDHRIEVFNNNRLNRRLDSYVDGSNDVVIHDFATGQTSSPWRAAMAAEEVRSISEGRSEIQGDGGVFVEESNQGRLLRFDAAGKVLWSYVNRADDGLIYRLNWSRLLPRDEGASILKAVTAASCPG